MGSRSDGTNPRSLGTNPRATGANPREQGTNPRNLSREERIDADLAAQRRAANRIAERNDEIEEINRAIPKSPMPEELRQWRRGEIGDKALISEEPPDDAWSDRVDLA